MVKTWMMILFLLQYLSKIVNNFSKPPGLENSSFKRIFLNVFRAVNTVKNIEQATNFGPTNWTGDKKYLRTGDKKYRPSSFSGQNLSHVQCFLFPKNLSPVLLSSALNGPKKCRPSLYTHPL